MNYVAGALNSRHCHTVPLRLWKGHQICGVSHPVALPLICIQISIVRWSAPTQNPAFIMYRSLTTPMWNIFYFLNSSPSSIKYLCTYIKLSIHLSLPSFKIEWMHMLKVNISAQVKYGRISPLEKISRIFSMRGRCNDTYKIHRI